MNTKKIAAFTSAVTLALFLGLGATSASAQVGDYPPGTPGTVGAPNTGAGGEAVMNIALLASSGAIALGGAAYLLRQRRAA
ncbi:MAG: hypothetical protein HZA81_01320 [Candidatus Taylorbacteria bacterium]|nr:hypothetical protein [Candidatus Taylorbacteria bacterium]